MAVRDRCGCGLVSILPDASFGWRWLDPVIGLGNGGLAIHEGHEAWVGEVCADCAPVGYPPAKACDDGCGS